MLVVEAVEVVCDPDGVDRDGVWCAALRGLGSNRRKLQEPLDEIALLLRELARRVAAFALGVAEDARDPGMRVLHVVHGVFLRPLGSEVDVDVDRLVVPARHQIPARRVDTDLVDQLVQEDHVAPPLRDLLRLAALDDVHELVDQNLNALGVVPEHRCRGLQPADVAVMVGAQNVDRTIEAAFELVPDVGDVGGVVEVRTVLGTDQRTILVVAVGARPRPDRSFRLVGVQLRQDAGNFLFDLALMAPAVDRDPKLRDLPADFAEHVLDRVDVERRELIDVLALVATLRQLLAAPACLHGGAEEVHLPAGVVEVVLALDFVARVGEQPCDRVAVGAVACGTDGERSGGIRRDQLDLEPLASLGSSGAVVWSDLTERLSQPLSRDPDVEKAGPGDLGPLDLLELRGSFRQLRCELLRRTAVLGGGPERDVRGVVAVRRIARPLEHDRHAREIGQPPRETTYRVNGQPSRAGRRAAPVPAAPLRCLRRSAHRRPGAWPRGSGLCRTSRPACAVRR